LRESNYVQFAQKTSILQWESITNYYILRQQNTAYKGKKTTPDFFRDPL